MGHKGKERAAEARGNKTSFNPNGAEDPLELLDMCVAALQDRRCTMREQAMAALVGALEALPPLNGLDSRCFVVFALCGISIKKGFSASASAKEARLAYRAVGLLALTLRAGASDLLPMAFPLLSKTLRVQMSHDNAPKLVAALDCLAAITFVGAVDAKDVDLSMKAIWTVISPSASGSTKLVPTAQVLAAAVSAWTFLVTVIKITPAQLRTDRASWNATVASLAELLDHGDRVVRMAAGKALAVCVELNLTQYFPLKDMTALACKVSDLADEAGGKGVSKTVLPEQRHLFRQIKSLLNDGDCPKEKVRMQLGSDRQVVTVSTWAKQFQLHFLRRFLGAGFLKHVQGNELFKEVFCIEADESKTSSIAQRRKIAKAKHKALNMDRDIAWERKNILCLPHDLAPEHHMPEKLLQIGWN